MTVFARRWSAALTGVALVIASTVVLAVATPADAAHPPSPPALSAVEPLAEYVPQTSCDPHIKSGTKAFGDMLVAEYAGTTYASTYPCGADGPVSEHYEGRAIDWMVSARDITQKAYARGLLKWLFKTDTYGNELARARRLGIMYIVWNNRIWGSWNGRWDPYDDCAATPQRAYDNSCHRTHMHISLSWEGALGQTSFWTGRAAGTDYGPCVHDGLNWSPDYKRVHRHPCPDHIGLTARRHASATYKALVPYAGARVGYGDTGPIVSAVQLAVGIPVTGNFGGVTRSAVKAYQNANRIRDSGKTNTATWRALLADFK